MPETVNIEILLECECGAVLHGETDTDNRIIVQPCQRCLTYTREKATKTVLEFVKVLGV